MRSVKSTRLVEMSPTDVGVTNTTSNVLGSSTKSTGVALPYTLASTER